MKEGEEPKTAAVSSLLPSHTSSCPGDMDPDNPVHPGERKIGVKDIQTRYRQTLVLLDQWRSPLRCFVLFCNTICPQFIDIEKYVLLLQ